MKAAVFLRMLFRNIRTVNAIKPNRLIGSRCGNNLAKKLGNHKQRDSRCNRDKQDHTI